ncbi:MAG: hypothetical protein M1820_009645 [Bogoriella megaspora]|nr:MAG: hypothetical protein M1820_009645 [Bogoriella megaspora]
MATPTILIVHGASQPSPVYAPLVQKLEAAGFHVEVPDYPSVGDDIPKMADNTADIEFVREAATSLVEAGKDVIALLHSYGGVVGSGALSGLSKTAREKKGLKGGVTRLVYATAFALREGERLPRAGNLDEVKQYGTYHEENETLVVSKEAAMYASFHDLTSEEGEKYYAMYKPQSVSAMWSKQVANEAWREIPSTYVYCTTDRIIPLEGQEQMVRNARELQPTAFDVEVTLETGHNPALSKVDELVEVVKKAAAQSGN